MPYIKKKKNKIKSTDSIVILYDDREKKPWTIDNPLFKFKKKRLLVGDYTIQGSENIVAIERKSGWPEIISNLARGDRDRFHTSLCKLSCYKTKCIVIEDSLDNAARCIKYANKKYKCYLTLDSIYHWIARTTMEHQIPIIMMGKPRGHKKQQFLYFLFTELLKQL